MHLGVDEEAGSHRVAQAHLDSPSASQALGWQSCVTKSSSTLVVLAMSNASWWILRVFAYMCVCKLKYLYLEHLIRGLIISNTVLPFYM